MIKMANNVQYLGSDPESIAGALHGKKGVLVDLVTAISSISGIYVGYRPEQKKFFLVDATTIPTRSGTTTQKAEEAVVDSNSVLMAYAHF